MQYFIFFFGLVFCIINGLIILGDIQKKKIYNSYLLSLFFLSVIGIIVFQRNISDISVIASGFTIALVVGFLCYYFSLLGAGDIKYILLLGIFIYPESYLVFVGNIVLISLPGILYTLIKKENRNHMKKVLREKKHTFGKNISLFNLLEFFNGFLIVFIFIKLGKIYIYENILQLHTSLSKNILLFISVICIVAIVFFGRKLWAKISHYLNYITGIKKDSLKIIATAFLFILLIILLFEEYTINQSLLIENLYKILTLYLVIYVCIYMLIFIYKNMYDEAEKRYISLGELQEGDKIDVLYFEKFLSEHTGGIDSQKKDSLSLLSGSLDKQDIMLLQELFPEESEENKIKIYRTHYFSPHIFLGFLLTFFLGDMLVGYTVDTTIQVLGYFLSK